MKKYLVMLMLFISLFAFTACNSDAVYHTVTIDYDIEWLPEFKITVKDGDTVTQPLDPEMEGWAFGGWKNESGEDFDFSAPVTSDITVKASWFSKNSTITLKDTSGNVIKKDSAKFGSIYKLPDLGYAIASCVDEEGNSVTDSVKVTKTSMVLTITKGAYKEYNVGDVGPGGGFIVYDAKNPGDIGNKISMSPSSSTGTSEELGWRYIEISAEDLPVKYAFGYYRTSENGENSYINVDDDEHKEIGSGKANTAALIEKMGAEAYLNETGSEKGMYAALAAATYDGGGYSDWFLPSSQEVFWLMTSLAKDSKYKITSASDYWTSTEEGGALKACSGAVYNAGGAASGPTARSTELLVRPFRYF